VLAQNGRWKSPDGLMLQWGHATVFGGGGATTVTFPSPFPNQCFNVQATVIANPSSGLAYTVHVASVAKNNFLLSGNRTDGTAVSAPQMDVYWQATGY
jgi:hypothetical protein